MKGSIDVVVVKNSAGITMFYAPYHQLADCISFADRKSAETGFDYSYQVRNVSAELFPHLTGDKAVKIP